MFELVIVFSAVVMTMIVAAWLSISPGGGHAENKSFQNEKPIQEADHLDMNDMLSINYREPMK